uniref:Uncharacterized protein n=1 Tax=Glossina palpalis gambiensis TaxID=67801 RepID=A0A1B0B0F5_9MUSC
MHKQTTASYPPHHTINQSSRDKDMKPRPNERTTKNKHWHENRHRQHCKVSLSACVERIVRKASLPACLPTCLPAWLTACLTDCRLLICFPSRLCGHRHMQLLVVAAKNRLENL